MLSRPSEVGYHWPRQAYDYAISEDDQLIFVKLISSLDGVACSLLISALLVHDILKGNFLLRRPEALIYYQRLCLGTTV